MNNNRSNNRRRGRGNNRQQGGQQTNRIDSRARGNAPQLLEKYRKLAHDAHLNGDRVAEETYLQYADHYFRVMADQRQRQEDARQPRRDDRGQDYGDDYGTDDDGYEDINPYPAYGSQPDRDRQHRPEREQRSEPREPRPEPRGAPARGEAAAEPAPAAPAPVQQAVEPGDAAGGQPVYEPATNPFVRDNRATRGLNERKPRRTARDRAENPEQAEKPDEGQKAQPAAARPVAARGRPPKAAAAADFDPATLPPSIAPKTGGRKAAASAPEAAPAAVPESAPETAEEKPRRRRARKAAPPADEAGGTLEAVNT